MNLSLFPEINAGSLALLDVVQAAPAVVTVHLTALGTAPRAFCGKLLTGQDRAAAALIVNLDHPAVCPICRRAFQDR